MIRELIGQELARQFTNRVTKRLYNAYVKRLPSKSSMPRSSWRPGSTLGRGRWNSKRVGKKRSRRYKKRNYKRRARGVSAKYVQRVANRGKERLHISYNHEVIPSPIILDGQSQAVFANMDKSFVGRINMQDVAYTLVKNPTAQLTGDNYDDEAEANKKWGHLQYPGFNGDYVFYQKTRGVLEVGLKTVARESTGDGVADSSLDDNAPWLVRVVCVVPRQEGASFPDIGFRSLSGDKVGFDSYPDYADQATAGTARFDCQQLIKNGMINKQDFKVLCDQRFELGAGNVAQTVSKKINFKFNLNKTVKFEGYNMNPESSYVGPSTLPDGSKIRRSFDQQWFVFATPSVYNTSNSAVCTTPINMELHGVTLALD